MPLLTVLINEWIALTEILGNPTARLIVAAILIFLGLWIQSRFSVQPMFIWVEHYWHLFRLNNKLHMRSLEISTIFIVIIGSLAIIGMVASAFLQLWMRMPFSTPLIFSVLVMLVIAVTPGIVGAPMLFFIKSYPPKNWMSNRVARLSS